MADPKRNSGSSEETPLLSGVNTQWEWWERPSEAHGVVKHLVIEPDSQRMQELARGGVNYNDETGENDRDIETLDPHSAIGGGDDSHKLGEFLSTAISGNDITGSVLYVSGFAAVVCGVWAPVALALVAVLLYLFRPIYTEVVTALPMNGGTYNVLLNTTSKQIASIAGALSVLSYIATAVVSSASAAFYLKQLWTEMPILPCVIIILAIFAFLNIIGIGESAIVAAILFVIHIATLCILIVVCCIKMADDKGHQFIANWHAHQPVADPGMAIFLGFGASMLGITGFETSANFVEEQKPGVFPKTLRNMWFAVSFFNPVISVLSFGVLELSQVTSNPENLLATMGYAAGGKWLGYLVSIDAVLVLSGSVLTAYVGVTGISRRLALDRIMPQILLWENKLRKTNHVIIISFFALCSLLYFIVAGSNPNDPTRTDTLSGVYTAAFLCVMTMFAIGNMLLKYKRSRLPRELITPWPVVLIATGAVIVASVSNLYGNPHVVPYFCLYFGATMGFFVLMFMRIRLLKIVIYFLKKVPTSHRISRWLEGKIQEINSTKVIFFTRDDNIATLNKAILYIRDNEQTNWILMVHVHQKGVPVPEKLEETCKILDQAYPKFRIDYVAVTGEFGPKIIDQISEKLEVPKNFMFLTTPSAKFEHKVSDFGGVRLVTH